VLLSLIISSRMHLNTSECQHRSSDRILCGYIEPAGCGFWAIDLQRFRSWDHGFGKWIRVSSLV